MAREISCHTSILNGLPVSATAQAVPPEPDVGIFGWGFEDVIFHWHSGSEVPASVYNRMEDEDWLKVNEDLGEALYTDHAEY